MAQPQAHSARLTQPVLAVGQRGRLGLQGADREQLQLSRRGRRAGKCSLQFERSYQGRKKLVGSGLGAGGGGGGRQLGPRGFREPPHSSHRASTAESSLGCCPSGCVSSLWSFLPTGGKRAKDHSSGLLLCTHTPSPHPASSPRGSRLLLGESPAPFLLGAPWLGLRILLLLLLSSGPANLALRAQAPKLAIWSEPTGLLRTKVGLDARRWWPSLVAQKRQALPSSRSRTSDLRMSVQV